MLFQPTNIIPDLKSGIGLGVIDATNAMKVSWQVNGDYPVMTGMSITIYLNDTASTQKYTTGKVSLSPPFYGANALGEPQYYSYTISAAALSNAGITNGNEYKLIITQYYAANGGEESVTQSSASVFITRANPSFALDSIPATVTGSSYTFSLSYSQAQGDTLDWVRYQIAQGSDTANPIYDSGNIYGAAVYECSYGGFRDGYAYSFKATAQTSSGVLLSTGWVPFEVSYSTAPTTGAVTAGVNKGINGINIDWASLSTVTGQSRWLIYREQDGSGVITKVADLEIDRLSITDFGAASGQGPYDYLVMPANGSSEIIGTAARSNSVNPIFYRWTLLECSENGDGSYEVLTQYHFQYNLESGSVGNNNAPNVLQNFTAMPTVQPAPQNYRTGTLKALIGTVSSGRYTDSLSLREALMALSTTEKPLFLKSSKGDVWMVRPNGSVTAATAEGTESLAQTVAMPWIALADGRSEAIWGAA